MLESAKQLITRYIDSTNSILSLAIHITECAKQDNIEELENAVLNRERLVNQLIEIREKIDTLIKATPKETCLHEIAIIKSWAENSFSLSSIIQDVNQYLIDYLTYKKDKISKEIVFIFEFQSKFKGYNLNNVKK